MFLNSSFPGSVTSSDPHHQWPGSLVLIQGGILHSSGWPQIFYVAENGLELLILLSGLPGDRIRQHHAQTRVSFVFPRVSH